MASDPGINIPNQRAYESIGMKIYRKVDGKRYWFTEWFRESSPFIYYPDDDLKKLPLLTRKEIFIRRLKEPESVLIR